MRTTIYAHTDVSDILECSLESTLDEARRYAAVADISRENVQRFRRILGDQDRGDLYRRLHDFDPVTAKHSLRVSLLAMDVADRLGYTPEETENLGIAGLLHDAGKMWVPVDVLNKPDRYTPDDFAEMDKHVDHLDNLRDSLPPLAYRFAKGHHDHYRDRVKNHRKPERRTVLRDHIARRDEPLNVRQGQRLLQWVDEYDALLDTDRPYPKPRMTPLEALRRLGDSLEPYPEVRDELLRRARRPSDRLV